MLTSRFIFLPLIAFALLVCGFVAYNSRTAVADNTSLNCTTSSITAVAVGNQLSTQVLATSSNRAYARIQEVRNAAGGATTTPSLSFNEDVPATAGNGLQLSTSTPTIDFGLNTDFPYIGAVQAITDTSSTTLRVTECTY